MNSWGIEIDLYQRANMRIDKIVSRADEQFQNFPIFGTKFWFCELKIFGNSLIFQLEKFQQFTRFKNLENCQIIAKLIK